MVPRTYPSSVDPVSGHTQMVAYMLPSVSGLTKWIDYIPVRKGNEQVVGGSYGSYVFVDAKMSQPSGQAWIDYIPVYEDGSATDAWMINAQGYIPYGSASTAAAIQAVRRNNGTMLYVPDNYSGVFTDSAGTIPVTTLGDVVGKLNDSAGSNHATQGTTAAKPLVTQLANGRKAMTFDGSNDFLLTGNPSITNACTIIMAYTQTGADGLFVMTGQNANGAELVKSGNVVYFSKASAGTMVSAPAGAFPQSVPHVLTARIDASGNAVIRKNGAVIASATVPTTFTATSGMGIGAQAGSSFPFPAQIQSYVLTNTAIPDADLKTIERWMAQQIGVTYAG